MKKLSAQLVSDHQKQGTLMDLLCDALLVEEILPHLPLKYVLRFGATARRYNAIVLSTKFHARYWQTRTRSGVLLQPLGRGSRADPVRVPRFLPGASASSESVPGADLAFMPDATARETAYLRRLGAAAGLAVVHSAAGLLLCSRGRTYPVHYYVCNPVTWQWVALPELPCPSSQMQSGVLTVDTAAAPARFQVVLFNHPGHWWKGDGGRLDLRIFSSDTGRWEVKQLEPPLDDADLSSPPILVQTGHAFWTRLSANQAVAYDAAKPDDTVYLLNLPPHGHPFHQTLGRRQDGTLQYAHSTTLELQVWDMQWRADGEGAWELVHQVSDAELLRRNPRVEAFVHGRTPSKSEVNRGDRIFSPLCFHPTQHDVVFLAVPGAVVSYSTERGTVRLECTLDDCHGPYPHDLFPYAHPPWPVQIPAIKSSGIPESLRSLPTPKILVLGEMLPCSCVLVTCGQ